jgi:hypothetical protein
VSTLVSRLEASLSATLPTPRVSGRGRGSVATAVSTRERRRSELWASWAPAAGRLAATPTARRREGRSLRWRDVLARPFRHEAAAPRARRDPGLGRSRCSPCRSPAGSASSSTSAESAGPPSRSEPGHPRGHAERPRPVGPPPDPMRESRRPQRGQPWGSSFRQRSIRPGQASRAAGRDEARGADRLGCTEPGHSGPTMSGLQFAEDRRARRLSLRDVRINM